MTVPSLIDFSAAQLMVIRRMCAADCNNLEFDAFLNMCRARGLNPLLKHIYAMVLNKEQKKDNKGNVISKPRQLVIIVSVDGQRVIANRSGNYRPDDRPPRFEIDPDLQSATNSIGLISCEVAVHIFAHGAWFPVPAIAYYEEFAPIVEEWAEDETGKRRRTGKLALDPKKPQWKKMPRVMLAKVAEMQALRRAFPDDFAGLYAEEEFDKSTSDMNASDIIAEAEREERQQLVGGPGIMVDWMSGGPLEKVALGQFFDRSMAFLKDVSGSPATIQSWMERNRHGLRDFWGYSKGDADELKRQLEKAKAVTVEPELDDEAPNPAKPARAKESKGAPAKDQILPALRVRTDEAKEPEGAPDVLRGDHKGLRKLAPQPPISTPERGASSRMAPGRSGPLRQRDEPSGGK